MVASSDFFPPEIDQIIRAAFHFFSYIFPSKNTSKQTGAFVRGMNVFQRAGPIGEIETPGAIGFTISGAPLLSHENRHGTGPKLL